MNLAFQVLAPLISFVLTIFKVLLFSVLGVLVILVVWAFCSFRCNPFTVKLDGLRGLSIRPLYFNLLRWVIVDYRNRFSTLGEFKEFGFTFYVGRQGSGKTSAMVEYLNRIHVKYPGCLIVTNFKYEFADFIMVDWQDLLNVRNGTTGVVFAIDEIHSEYSAASWKDVPENLLSEISQQRKQRVKIVGSTQFFARVAKPLREQASTVVVCSSMFGRLIRTKTYDALEYSAYVDNPITVTKKLKPVSRRNFILSDYLRGCFDTYEKINRMRKMEEKNRRAGKP